MDKELNAKMQALGIREEDIEEKFVRSAGKGGQNVNKVSSCVCLQHIPSRIRVKCQEERSQRMNRLKARWILLQKIAAHNKHLERVKIDRFEKQRRKNRKRPKNVKEAILSNKREHSQKKLDRRKIHVDD